MLSTTKRQYFDLIRAGTKGAAVARWVGVSTSCGSLWFIDAGSVIIADPPISSRFLTQDDRIAIADGLQAKTPVKTIAAGIGKSFQSVYREIAWHVRPDGRYLPYWAHNSAVLRRRRPKEDRIQPDTELHRVVTAKVGSALVTPADLEVLAAHLHQRPDDACLRRDDLSGPVRRQARRPLRHVAHPSPPTPQATPRCADDQQDQEHAPDPRPAVRGQRPPHTRSLGRRFDHRAADNAQRSAHSSNASAVTSCSSTSPTATRHPSCVTLSPRGSWRRGPAARSARSCAVRVCTRR